MRFRGEFFTRCFYTHCFSSDSESDLSVGAPPAAEAPLCVFQVLREAICGADLEGPWCQAGEEDRDEATLLR